MKNIKLNMINRAILKMKRKQLFVVILDIGGIVTVYLDCGRRFVHGYNLVLYCITNQLGMTT